MMKEEQLNIDEEEIKKYFPMEHVVQSTLDIYQELLSLKFTKVKNPHTWHEEVSCFRVYDKESNN